jgi:hypothetical protein
VLVAESAVTVAALGVGVAFLLMKNSAQSRLKSAQDSVDEKSTETQSSCNVSPEEALAQSCDVLDEAIEDYNRNRTVSAAGFVTAGIGALGVGLTALLWPSSPGAAASTGGVSSLQPHVQASTHGGFLTMTGTF